MDLAQSIIKGMGLDPAQIVGAVQSITTEVANFKNGFRQAVTHFVTELRAVRAENAVIIRNQARIMAHLGIAHEDVQPVPPQLETANNGQ